MTTAEPTRPAAGPDAARPSPVPRGTGDPYGALLRGGAVPAVAAGVIATVVLTVLDGVLGLVGSLLAVAVVLVSFTSTVLVLRRTSRLDPTIVLAVAMLTYTTKVGLLVLFLVLFGDADWLSPRAFGLAAIATALAWTVGEVVAFTKVRTYIFDQGGSPAAEARNGAGGRG